ncbi:MAG: isopentenyl phosphate kinase [Chloroflexota bacterium]|nr:isopentenyl phosphate kinase [Chloroflexota bacterium]MDE2910166.1 isopentenyl phosphate kinase [Chloroflexota bacterium]
MTILIKLGGSLITNKSEAKSFRREIVSRIARQVTRLRALDQNIPIVIGHGSGSFGHFEAKKYSTIDGVSSDEQRLGFARVGAVAAELSLLVQNEFLAAGLPTMRFQPSSIMLSSAGRLNSFDSGALSLALDQGLIPLIHGDIALDERIGGTIISTESLFARLVQPLRVTGIILLGAVEGVLDHNDELISCITPASFAKVRSSLAGSHGIDVTGGMLQKVETMIALIDERPSLEVFIADGRIEDVLLDLLIKRSQVGTLIRADSTPTPSSARR